MKLINLTILSLLVVFLTGCVSLPKAPETPADYSNKVQISDSKFDSHIKFSGYTEATYKNGLLPESYKYFIRSWKNKKNNNIKHQLYISFDYFGDWRFYNSASFDDSRQTDVTEIDRTVLDCSSRYFGCNVSEDVAVDLSSQFLKSKINEGFSVRINSKRSYSDIVTISPNYIAGYLSVVK